MDRKDPLRDFRGRFRIPQRNDRDCIYLCGNSLGLQPSKAADALSEQLTNWASLAVEGHFEGTTPWMTYHKLARQPLCQLTGANENEVVAMNSLTVNLHLLLVSFYRPQGSRNKIMMERGAFPSDQYAIETHLRWHGLDPEECIIEVMPDIDGKLYSTQHIVNEIRKAGDSLAVVLFGGIQYYTGQLFDMAAITRAAHGVGALAGFDLAHAIGNVPLSLHDWSVDFAAWCSYKYLNSSPGGISGVFIHDRHAANGQIPRFAGWWGHNEKERFRMEKGFDPILSADGWQLSNAPALLLAPHLVSLQLFEEAGMDRLREKSIQLTGYLEFLLDQTSIVKQHVQIITPKDAGARGCQLSLYVAEKGRELFAAISKRGVVGDWREPNVIRVAPVPLYNSFEDVFQFAAIVEEEIHRLTKSTND